MLCHLLLLSTHSLDPCLWGKSDPVFGPPASLSLHLASSSITPAGSVHKSRSDGVVRMWVQLRWCVCRVCGFCRGGIVVMNVIWRLQTTQPTSGGAVTADKNCCANCVEPSRPQQWGPDLPFFGHAGHADPLDGWRCCSQKRVMSRPIQVRQH